MSEPDLEIVDPTHVDGLLDPFEDMSSSSSSELVPHTGAGSADAVSSALDNDDRVDSTTNDRGQTPSSAMADGEPVVSTIDNHEQVLAQLSNHGVSHCDRSGETTFSHVAHDIDGSVPISFSSPVIDACNIPDATDISQSKKWERAVHEHTARPICLHKLPWEQGIMQSVFNSKRTQLPAHLQMPRYNRMQFPSSSKSQSTSVIDQPEIGLPEVSWWAVRRRINSMEWKADLDCKRVLAMERCRTILQLNPKHSALGRVIMADVNSLADDKAIQQSLVDVLSNKATKTILKRTASFQKYILWCNCNKRDPMPVTEANVYAFLRDMVNKPPSFSSSFKEALGFMHGTIGVDGCKEAYDSKRVSGFCSNMALTKRPRVQAPPLTVDQVKYLEEFVCGDGNPTDRAFAGHCLLCIYTRSRWSDLQHAGKPIFDEGPNHDGYFQLHSLLTKTSNTVLKKTTFLPMVAPFPGTTQLPWLVKWLALRKQVGLADFNVDEPSFPVVLVSGKFGKLPLPSNQAGQWIRSILAQAGLFKHTDKKITSHGFKATLLSWCAKFGVSKEHRSILGYHIQDTQQSMLHYSRDEQSAPLRSLKQVLQEIRIGSFKPDATRSGYHVVSPTVQSANSTVASTAIMIPTAKSAATPSVPRSPIPDSSDSSSSSEGDSSAVISEDEAVTISSEKGLAVKKRKKSVDSQILVIHSRSRILHSVHDNINTKLRCGRPLNAMYRILAEFPSFKYPKCADCFGRE
jgi:hypothetical protein